MSQSATIKSLPHDTNIRIHPDGHETRALVSETRAGAEESGAAAQNRTVDLALTKGALYP